MSKANNQQTIACLITPSGAGGIAIIQITGSKAFTILQKEFKGKRKTTNSQKLYHGFLYADPNKKESIIDEILINFLPASQSPTEKNLLEISCHGGLAAVEAIFSLLKKKEIQRVSKEVFLNNLYKQKKKSEIKALNLLLNSCTEMAARIFTYQLNGCLTKEINHILADFSHPDTTKRLEYLLQTSKLGLALAKPAQIVIAGKPNAGKSTLFNQLLGRERVLVHNVPGTTRDAIVTPIEIRGIPFFLVDTAGLRETSDAIETLGIKATRHVLEQADYILWLLDVSLPIQTPQFPPDLFSDSLLQSHSLTIAFNKLDISNNLSEYDKLYPEAIKFSALTGEGIENLEDLWTKEVLSLAKPQPFPVLFDKEMVDAVYLSIENIKANQIEKAREILTKVFLE